MRITSKKKYEDFVKPRLLEVGAWARNGMTEKEMAKKLGVAYSTFRKYKKEHSALLGTLQENKEIVDIKVENALLKRALGYTTVEITEEKEFNEKTNQYDNVKSKEITREVKPDVNAIEFWLKNRKRQQWSSNPQMVEIKKEEVEIRRKESESRVW